MLKKQIEKIVALVLLTGFGIGIGACSNDDQKPQFQRTKSTQKREYDQNKKDTMPYTSNRKVLAAV